MFDALAEAEAALEKLVRCEQTLDPARTQRLQNLAAFVHLRAIDEYDRSGAWVDTGHVNAAAGIRSACGVSHGAAHADLTMARKLRDLPRFADAFAAGTVTKEHVRVVARAATAERVDALRELEPALVDAALAATPPQLRAIVDHVCGALDGDDGASIEAAQYDRQRFHASATLDGMVAVDGLFTAEDGEFLMTVVKNHSRRIGEGTPAQARADAVIELLRCGYAHAERGPGRNALTELEVRADLSDLERRGGGDAVAAVRAHVPGLPGSVLRRIACDCRVSRVLTDGPSLVLDVGRATRVIPRPLWAALVARDGGCTWPGCDRPPGWCDGHHIRSWADGGATDLGNLRLLCRRHHRMAHGHRGADPP